MKTNRQLNHIKHHKTLPSYTLMRRSVSRPDLSTAKSLKAHSVRHQESVTLGPTRTNSIDANRLSRAIRVERSQYVNHFSRPLSTSFVPSHLQPIKSVVNKPETKTDLSMDELLLKAVDNIEDQLLNLEQQPVRRLQRFTRSLVANRFNGIALD